MKLSRSLVALSALALAILAGCRDSTSPVPPAAIELVAGDAQSGVVAKPLAISPTFIVVDAAGNSIERARVSVSVKSGGGKLENAPDRTSSGPTSVGTWTLGQGAGENTLAVTVDGLPSLIITATAKAGATVALVPLSATALSGRVGEQAQVAPAVRVVDAFQNPIAGALIQVNLTNGGTAAASVTSDAQGVATVPQWIFSTVAGQSTLTFTAAPTISASFVVSLAPGDPASLLSTGTDQRGVAGASASAITLRVADKYGNVIGRQTATLAVTDGGGTLAASSATSGDDGIITLPKWTFGKSAVVQKIHATIASLSTDLTVQIPTDYKIDVRFFGTPMTDKQKAWFTNAAARISGAITGDVPDVAVSALNVSEMCGISGLPVLNETIDDLVIYAAVQNIDGPGKILAQAGPCVIRSASSGSFSVVGVMEFDAEDMDRMERDSLTQGVITHEMLHVVGIGTLWQLKSLVTAVGTTSVTYWGAQGKQACLGFAPATPCATSVPVENNLVPGTSDAHWRETTFGNELMTGYANVGGMPFSAMTIGSLGDIGYTVNLFAADAYALPVGGASGNLIPGRGTAENWERPLPSAVVLGAKAGDRPTFIRKPNH